MPSPDQLFPALTPDQIARVSAHAAPRHLQPGHVLYEPGQPATFVVVKAGRLEIVRPSGDGDTRITALGSGQFSGEANMLSGRRSLVRVSAAKASDIVELTREQLLALIQTDSELSEILMRAFILRRVELIARGLGDVVLVGSMHSPGTLRI